MPIKCRVCQGDHLTIKHRHHVQDDNADITPRREPLGRDSGKEQMQPQRGGEERLSRATQVEVEPRSRPRGSIGAECPAKETEQMDQTPVTLSVRDAWDDDESSKVSSSSTAAGSSFSLSSSKLRVSPGVVRRRKAGRLSKKDKKGRIISLRPLTRMPSQQETGDEVQAPPEVQNGPYSLKNSEGRILSLKPLTPNDARAESEGKKVKIADDAEAEVEIEVEVEVDLEFDVVQLC